MEYCIIPVGKYSILEIGLEICFMDMEYWIISLILNNIIQYNLLIIKILILILIHIGLNIKDSLVMIKKMALVPSILLMEINLVAAFLMIIFKALGHFIQKIKINLFQVYGIIIFFNNDIFISIYFFSFIFIIYRTRYDSSR